MISLNCTHGWGAIVFWFILFTFFAGLVLMSLLPGFVLAKDSAATAVPTADPTLVLGYSMLFAVIALVVAYLAGRY